MTEEDGRKDIWGEINSRIAALSREMSGELTAEELKDLWYRRALDLSRSPVQDDLAGDRLNLVTFRLGSDRYGVGMEMVREIQRAGSITPVPTAPDFVVGVMNLRGSILSVVDIRTFFGLPGVTPGTKARILVVEGGGLQVGILVEGVDEITSVRVEEIKPPLSTEKGLAEDYLRGIVTARGEVLMVVDLQRVLENPRLVVEEKV